jgi:murein L,D-transpeptidase YafK
MNLVFDRHQRRFRVLAAILLLLGGSAAAHAEDIQKADRILVLKGKRELRLIRGDDVIKTYRVSLGFHPKGPKRRRGDGRTPEGVYIIDGRTSRTAYHLALHISYPNTADRMQARAAAAPPGGNILIHGMPERFGRTDPVGPLRNWTNGCVAVGNLAIEEIWAAVDDGTPIEIRP